ncbi:universal stress protein [Variovorax sp. EBFNA2]|uniref:universal stress protein n=1 Tax=Variovorax sp. EBFNA2 TaxID=3342097 RepID=UPI0029C0CE0E|nr:universal stress protein [Variovorax boronicumulans]WPG40936.1 universal stress protein [Variovorax boronicumulans]
MYHRILVPIDGSPVSLRGLEEAIRLAELTGAVLRLVHVVDELKYVTGFERLAGGPDLVLLMEEAGEQILQQGRERAEHAGIQTETLLFTSVSGRLCDLVAEQARAWNADLIVMGAHGRRGGGRVPLGSGADEILRLATVPVLLVRSPSDDDEAGSGGTGRIFLTT